MADLSIKVDLTDIGKKFNIPAQTLDMLTETAVAEVTAAVYTEWQNLAKRELHSTLPEYLRNLNVVTKGRFARQIVLGGILPTMLEQGASPFDMKVGFEKSEHVKYTIPVYNRKGKMIYPGGDWYLTVPFRQGTPGIVGQSGFANEMPAEIYKLMVHRPHDIALTKAEIPSPYDIPQSRAAIYDDNGGLLYAEYEHKASIYEGLVKKTGVYGKTTQNTYVSFRRVGKNSDPLSWISKGLKALRLADKAIENTDVTTIVENEVADFLNKSLGGQS